MKITKMDIVMILGIPLVLRPLIFNNIDYLIGCMLAGALWKFLQGSKDV